MAAVTLENIRKTYSPEDKKEEKIVALDNVSFSVEEGDIFGIIGPDGAGKTSLFRILTTLILPDSGKATVLGYDIVKEYEKIRNIIGYMPGRFSLYQDLTIEENLNFFATLFNTTIEQSYYLIKDIYEQIEPFKKRRAGQLSGGMKQKLALCCALIHKPNVLFLDEPTTGVDAVSRKEFWDMLNRLKKQNITILVSTPYMDEAKLCDKIALILGGKILTIDTPAAIEKSYPGDLYSLKSDKIYKLLLDLRKYEQTLSAFSFGQYVHASFKNSGATIESEVHKYLQEQGNQGVEIKKIEPTIEDRFISLLNK